MNQFAVTSVILIVLQSSLSALANVKITPIAVDNKSNVKSNDMKVEEARYRDPIMPEYYDRNRQGFVTSSYLDNYGGSAFDRYGYNNNNYNTNTNNPSSNVFDKSGTTYFDRYGSKFSGLLDNNNRERFGSSYGMNGASSLENKFGGLFGSKFGSSGAPPPPPISTGGAMYGPYNSPSYIGGSPIIGGSSLMGGNPLSGFMTPELEHKTSVILPLAGAALLGIAAYALVSGPGLAVAGPLIGKRRKRSLFDEKVEQHLAYRAHNKKSPKA